MTKNIQHAVCKWLAEIGHESICENYTHSWEMDVATMTKSGLLREFEVKISRSDFLADKKKIIKFAHYEMKNEKTAPNYFGYVCPTGLIKPDEIPSYAGLYYYLENGNIDFIKECKRIHNGKVNKEKVMQKMLRLNIQRKYLGGSMITFLNRKSKIEYDKLMEFQKSEREKNESMFSDNE